MTSLTLAVMDTTVVVRLGLPSEGPTLQEVWDAVKAYDGLHLTCVGRLLDLAEEMRLRGDTWVPNRGRYLVLGPGPSPDAVGGTWMMLSPAEREAQARGVADDLVARGERRATADTAGVLSLRVPRDESVRLLAALTGKGEEYARERLRCARSYAVPEGALARRRASVQAGTPAWLVPEPVLTADPDVYDIGEDVGEDAGDGDGSA